MAFNLFEKILWTKQDPTQGLVYKALSRFEPQANNVTEALKDTTKMYEQKAQNISQWAQNTANKPWYVKLWQLVKSKYPEYSDMSDEELGQKMLAKYPEYKDIVSEQTTALGQWAKILWGIGSMAVSAPWMVTGGAEQLGTWLGTIASARSGQDITEWGLQALKWATTAGFWVATGAMPFASTAFWGATGFEPVQQGLGYVAGKAGDISAGTAGFLGGNQQVQEQARGLGEIALPAVALKWVSVGGKYVKPVTQATGKAIVQLAEYAAPKILKPVRKIGDTIWNKYTQAKTYLSGLDEKSQEAIRNTSASEMDAILKQANATIWQKWDYVQTPYHVWAEKAQKTLNAIDDNLKVRQTERMTALDEAPVAKIDLSEARNTARKALDELNVEDIQDGMVISKKWREAFIDADNQSDITAFNKLKEILADDVSPTQTMDRIKKLQEWVYENKSRIGFKGVSDKMERVLTRVQWSMNSTFKKQLPPEYTQIMDSMSSDIKLKEQIKEMFWIDDAWNTIWNKWEMVMKRLTSWTTTGWKARELAIEIKNRYGIDLIKEARLRQMAMDLVGDDRWQTLFGAIARGKSGLIDLVTQKTLGKIVNKEWVVRKLATGKAEVVKKPKPLYQGNTFRKWMADEAKMAMALPAPSGKATGAKNVRVNQPKEKSPLETIKGKSLRPGTSKPKEVEKQKLLTSWTTVNKWWEKVILNPSKKSEAIKTPDITSRSKIVRPTTSTKLQPATPINSEKTVLKPKEVSNVESRLIEEAKKLWKYDKSYDVVEWKDLYRWGSKDWVFWTDDIDIAKSFWDEWAIKKKITIKKPLDVRSKDVREFIKKNSDINIDDATSAYSRSLPEFKKLMQWAKERWYDGIIWKTSDNWLSFTWNEFVIIK